MDSDPTKRCILCKASPVLPAPLWSAFPYDGALEHLIRLYKYGPVRHLGSLLAELFVFAALSDQSALEDLHDPLVCIIPSSRSSMSKRGFQHVGTFALRLGAALSAHVRLGALQSARERRAQAGLPLRSRIENVKDAFCVKSKLVRGRDLLVVDDVVTTGATANQAAAALYASGAARVRVLTLARSRRFVHHRMEQLLSQIINLPRNPNDSRSKKIKYDSFD